MAYRRGISTIDKTNYRGKEHDDNTLSEISRDDKQGKSYIGKYSAPTMPLAQDKLSECNITNNNDQNYLHKKFKKMASTISISTTNYSKENEVNCKDLDVAQTTNSSISNGSISAAHPEIEKIKKPWLDNLQLDKDVQIKFSNYINRLGEININNSGQTSNSEEFSSKTDNHENDFTKDVQTYGPSGRYVCPYCKLSCAKPSVLQKHIRAHTNERPYPCVPCGFAFKTKSNLYKHRRSRTHALRLQGTDVSAPTHDEESSAESESDNSLPPASASDTWLDTANTRLEMSRPNEFSSPELGLDRVTPPVGSKYDNKGKTLYKPKFRAALYQESDDRQKKPFSPNADFLNEHISKIISNNEAIVDVIETPLQKKYGKIKQIAESKQLSEQFELKSELGPLNLTKSSGETDNGFRKRSHSESFSQHNQKHPLNPEGSIIKDLLLKTKASNGVTAVPTEIVDGSGPLYICPLCQIPYRSVDNLEIHRTYYCKGNLNNVQIAYLKEVKAVKPEDVYVRSNSIHSKMPERSYSPDVIVRMRSSPLRINKPNDIVIVKPENNEVLAPLPSPGPLLGNTRLVDSRLPLEYSNKSEQYKVKPMQSPKRKIDSRSDTYSPRQIDSPSPRLIDMYAHSKIRCLEQSPATLRSFDDFSNNRHNSASLQMFGGEVKIVDYSGGTTTLRIEPSKCQLSPILIQEHMSPSKQGGDAEASSVVVRSGLHSGGTIVHNLPTPKDTMSNSQPRISTASHLHKHLHENTHFQFPPLSAITAFNPLTLPPLSPSVSPNGASTILHAGKFIPHVPGMPGPNTPAIYLSTSVATKISNFDVSRSNNETMKEVISASYSQSNSPQNISVQKSLNLKPAHHEVEKALSLSYNSNIPTIKVKNVDEPVKTPVKVVWTNTVKSSYRSDGLSKKNVECLMKTPVSKEVGNSINTNQKNVERLKVSKNSEEVSNYNFENLITKAEIYNNQIPSSSDVQKNTNAQDCTKTSVHNERSETLYFQKNNTTKSEERKPKFLRPSTLPLKPGTFTPKRHHGITPNANTMPLVSPETPRPAKAYGQLYLNGNAYTYLGLKCSTKVFYCTINRPQPTYVPNQHFLSMYSNWQLLSELTPDPLGLTAATAMSLYDSRHRPQSLTIAMIKQELILTHSSQWKKLSNDHKPMIMAMDSQRADELRHNSDHTITPKKEVTGGFESNEEYTYIRGRGRGRYVCSECGIRCKKPSMLKKHIRTHTDVRPYTCVRCSFSFKTKGNLTKHMKSKAHYKKCCELGINPNEGNENGELNQGLGETDEETDSDGDEGNEGETESSDTETCKSRLPEHEAAHCLLSLGCSRPTTSRTPGLITSARPTTYPYNPTGQDGQTSEHSQQPLDSPHVQNQPNEQNKMDVDNEPMDLSRNEIKCNITEIPTARESSVLASLASNTAKLPQHQNQWSNGEPMLHAYLTERALQDSKIKQSQLTSSLSKIRKNELEKAVCQDKSNVMAISNSYSSNNMVNTVNTLTISMSSRESPKIDIANIKKISINNETSKTINALMVDTESKSRATQACDNATNTENAKFVVSEYLRHAKVNVINDKSHTLKDGFSDLHKDMEEYDKLDDNNSETESIKLPVMEHDLVAQKVVIGAGGVAFKVSTKGKDFDSSSSYNPGKLMEDGRRVCDFCNKTFTKPSQLRLHLNIHYMERPFRCSACAVSFRTRGHLQKHERSGSHHNKVSMTSTFGAATSLNPRPFRCSDCNIAFRIHGHLAKHLRSKMHVMRLECLFKLPFGTFTEIERAGVSLTDIDTTDCASSLASLQVLAQKLHEKDPSKLEYRDPSSITVTTPPGRESSEDEDGMSTEKFSESEKDSEMRTKGSDSSNIINAPTMPLAQDKLSECNITNNNDQNYLHKKFKKMASTISISTTNYSKENEVNCKDLDVAQTTNSSISNGSISAAHPEIEKIKKPWLDNLQLDKDVQIKFSNYINRLGEININNSGQTSNSEEFSSKTDNHENDFTKDVQTYGPSGRYVCPYCKLSCAKPSVLQKHIRAHTNERPYPCVPCGFAFKTKSNLYKHRRSRTHALRLQGTDVSAPTHDEESSAESESDNSLPPASASDTWLDTANTRLEMSRPNEFSSPELGLDRVTPPVGSKYDNKGKTLYKPKFRAALYQESDDRQKKPFSPNADFLNEHISKIISNNEAIVDVIETPLQKKYGKIKQIAESKQLSEQFELKSELGPLNLTKSSGETDNGFRKRSHSESFSQHNQKHPLNPEGSIIKDLLLKTKASNGVTAVPTEIVDGSGPLYICPLCQIPYRSVDNLEIHRTYYCKGNLNNVQIAYLKEVKAVKPEDVYVRSNSIHSKMPERSYSPDVIVRMRSSPLRINKPNDIVIVKPENNEVLAPLPSPGPLLGNTRLVDSRLPLEYSNKSEQYKVKPMQSPKRKIDSRSDTYSPRQIDSPSPRLIDMYAHSKIRCLEQSPATLRSFDDFSNNRHNSASLQMFGGEVKIVDYSGGTTTLRIEPSKCQLSPILIQEHMSPSKQGGDAEASSVVVRSGLHSGGTIVHNLPTPKDTMSNSQPRISTASHLHKHLHENTHFQFPPLSAITAFNPLTLPPLSPSVSPNGASTILHAGKFIPHVPGMPGPNTPAIYLSTSVATKISNFDVSRSNNETMKEVISASYSQSNSPQNISVQKSLNLKPAHHEVEKALSLSYNSNIPTIKVKNVDEPVKTPVKVVWTNTVKSSYRSDGLSKKNVECLMKTPVSKEVGNSINTNQKNVERLKVSKNSEEVSNYNFENLITKAEIYNNQIPSSSDVQKNTNAQDCTKTSVHNERSETLYFQKNNTTKSEERKPKFLRPSTLPLKPGTFTPKRHHGITPNANTMPLVSPETPRPAKAYGQLYLNGNAYTYLGLKCSTKVFYCTINRPQPTYVPNQHFLSMYSNWQLLSELTPDPLGLTAATAMSLYDSRHRPQSLTIAMIKQELILTHSSQWKKLSNDHKPMIMAMDSQRADELRHNSDHTITPKKEVTGGFESNEEYTYIRGRGRGRYVCSECGIRCKKPSMLKKHIRTHTDVRPYTCVRCSFSFKTKGNLTKHMKSKAHYKKCCELGINPNEGNENGELNQGLGETDEETDSDGDEGNEGETESSDTETCKSRLPEHEAAHCLLSLGCSRPTTSRTPGLITSARPTTYPYNPTGQDGQTSEHSQQPLDSPHVQNQPNEQNKMDVDNEPMDLSRNEIKCNITEIPTARESSVLASLASNTAKLPQHQNQWSNGEPMLHAYLTERALQDSKIKQSQLTSSLSKIRKNELEKAVCQDKSNVMAISNSYSSNNMVNTVNTLTISMSSRESPKIDIANIKKISINNETSKTINALMVDTESKSRATQACDNATNTENAKFVVSEYLRHAKVNVINDKSHTLKDGFSDLHKDMEEYDKLDDNNSETESIKLPVMEHDLVAQKVVIGAGGVAFKVSTKGKDFDSSSSYNPGKLMEDGRRVCDFCNKTFTKPSQLRLHLNIHYMERPFRCSACAVSFRTRGHLQKHERSGSHHNKVSMTSTFGAATSLNPRPFRCSDCNIAFRIHGHLAKHLRSKMHVMRLECLFKLPFGTFTEIERAGVSLTDIDTTDCASSLASLQVLAQKLHEKDPSKLEYRDPSSITVTTPPGRESSEDEDGMSTEKFSESEKDSEMRTKGSDSSNIINAPTMPLAQDKLSECNITNNNDQNYLHKKFKKMASTISISTTNYSKENEVNCKDLDVAQTTNSSISNGSISAAHPEIEKIKKPWLDNLQLDKDVQIKFSNYINRLGEININNSGQTSNSEEFSSKTDNHENDFTKDVQTYGPSGRYVCPYCKLSCAKPSVLQKHIRAHTNERPYPCVPCGFAFKTKSNLYKHRRSRTHALRLQGTDVSAPTHDEESSAESESDNSLPPASASDTWLDTANTRLEMSRPNEFSSPELGLDRVTPPVGSKYDNKGKTLYKPKFRAALYQESDDRQKKPFSPNADFLNEHISKIISNNEAIVDVIETPLQKKYGKIKQIAESKQLSEQFELKSELGPLNLTKSSGETDNGFRKRSHSESFSQHNQKHPLNPEGSIIKDLLLKTKASNGVTAVPTEIVDGSGPLYICPLCQIPYRSVDNLEIHRTYYCKGNLNNVQIAYLKEVKAVKPEDVYVRSNSIHSKMPERSYSPDVIVRMRSSPLRINKPNDIVIVKPENNEVLAPLPSPGPLLGNTRLVDSRLPLEYSNKSEQYKVKPMQSPKRKIDSRSDTYSPRQIDSPSPRLIDMYAHSKIRCLEQSPATLRSFDDFSNNRHNSASLQMFGGEVKIVDYSGGTTTLRIEPSKCQLSPILIQEHMSPSKQGGDAEASSVVVRSGLHSGGTIVHNLPTPKDTMSNSQPRISTASHLHKHLHENTHFQFPPLSAITAFNPLTLPPLSPSVSPNGASTILHAGKFIPHVPGMPGPNTPAIYLSTSVATKISNFDVSRSNNETMKEVISASYSQSNSPQNISVQKSLNLKPAHHEVEKALSLSYNSNIPTIKVKNVDEPVKTPVKVVWTNTVKSSYRSDGLSKKNVECLMKTPVSKEVGNSINTNQKNVERLKVSKNSEEVSNYNFENLITKAEIYNNQIPSSSDVQKNTNAQDCTKTSVHNERSETLYFQKNNTTKSEERKPKFLRPSTLPLKPGTFTPKRHHGITPNANTMPLVSPETPRPAKAYGQLYLNGNAYTYLGLKCSTKVFYCTINRPQPTYVPNQHFLSMYSNWQLLSELTPDPLGLTAATAMSLYDSRHRPQSLTIAMIKQELILTHSSQWKKLSNDHKPMIMAMDSQRADELRHNSDHTITPKKEVTGGFESNEEYTYIRGRGRGRYVCSECGIRCKKPSMLKKHIRTHTDVRPYTCVRCSFSFKTKGNLTKHMKSKAHYKKCCELGINPNEGNENGELNQGLGETDEETDSDGDEGNEGETESSDTETCKSRLPEHEAAHCLLSLGCSRPTTSRTPGLITSARPTTYPYNPTGQDGQTSEHSQQPLDSPHVQNQPNEQNKMDVDNEPMDLSRNEIKCNITEIPTARESSVLASLASNTAKLPQHQNQWSNGEPMLHAYLTERALQDSKIKQSQLTSSLSKIRKNELEKAVCQDKSNVMAISNSYSSNNMVNTVNTLTISMSSRESPKIDIANIKKISINNETSKTINALMVDTESKSRATQACDNATNTENAKFVVSEYLRHAKVNVINDKSHTLKDGFSDLHKDMEEYDKLDDNNSETESIKLPVMEHDLVAQKVVIGAGGVAFKVSTKGKDFDSSSSYNPGKLMEDGRRVCDFCNKTFTKPSQLRLHLNIHYMERPFRCSACAVSFRTRGHLQKHERSGSHHNKVSMTSTFGAATSLNPRPFRCSDCNIAFRIHGHLAKHLRSKMHVMRLECLFKLPFGTFTEIERAGVSLTDIDTTDCASSLASLQVLAQKLHEKDPSKLEYRDPSSITVTTPPGRESSEDEDGMSTEKFSESEKDSEMRTKGSDSSNSRIIYSATDN